MGGEAGSGGGGVGIGDGDGFTDKHRLILQPIARETLSAYTKRKASIVQQQPLSRHCSACS